MKLQQQQKKLYNVKSSLNIPNKFARESIWFVDDWKKNENISR